jgi:hypothetical protein
MRNITLVQRTAVLASGRDRIREAAKSLFARQGYEATTTAAICRLVGHEPVLDHQCLCPVSCIS